MMAMMVAVVATAAQLSEQAKLQQLGESGRLHLIACLTRVNQ